MNASASVMHLRTAVELRTTRVDLGIWLIAAAAAMVLTLAVWQVRPSSPLPALQPHLSPTTAPVAPTTVPGPIPATEPTIAPDGARPEAPPAAPANLVVAPKQVRARPTAPASVLTGAQNGPAVVNPGSPAAADDPPATQQATGEASPPRKGDLGN